MGGELGHGDAHVALEGVSLAFGERVVFSDLSCAFPRARISVMMGGSGCGKSTVLRMIGGLQRPDRGSVRVLDRQLVGLSESGLREVRLHIGMLFQNGALLDSMTVFDNVALPLRERRKLSGGELADAVHERLESVGLEGVDHLLPGELSGGMLRRVALARAIILDPDLVLCDEPFSGLDPPNVGRIEELFTKLCRERGLTLIVTSHHMASSLRMADQLVLLRDGGAVCGSPRSLATSAEPEIAEFLGADGRAFAQQVVAESGT